MGKTWFQPLFKHILVESCEEFINSSNKGKHKTRSTLINRVAEEIRQAVEGTNDTLPSELEKVIFAYPPYLRSSIYHCRRSEHGFKTRLPDMLTATEARSPRGKCVVIQVP
jgi:hypothetical protein